MNRGVFMSKLIKTYLRNESGAAAAEYALILAIIGSAVAAAVITLGNDIGAALTTAGGVIAGYTY